MNIKTAAGVKAHLQSVAIAWDPLRRSVKSAIMQLEDFVHCC